MSQTDGTHVESFVAEELGNSAYLIVSRETGEAAVIDPLRDIEQYLARAEALGARITLALETHIHNDFVSGARELVRETGAELLASAGADLAYPHRELADGETLALGSWSLRAVASPGHTPEHVSYLLLDEQGQPHTLFSGGSLMVGGIARPDLLGPQHTAALARAAYETAHQRLLILPDEVYVYPTHGAGSFCGAGGDSGDGRTSTIGRERRFNPLLRATTYQQFLTRYLQLSAYPAYYQHMRPLNRAGAPLLGRSLPALRPLTAEQVMAATHEGAVIVDTRHFERYDESHIPNSLSVPIDGPVSAWVGWVLAAETPLILLGATRDDEREAQRELLRIGYDNILGTLEGGVEAWQAAGYTIRAGTPITTEDIAAALMAGQEMAIVDSRDQEEWSAGHIPGAIWAPVAEITEKARLLAPDAPTAIHCAHGYRSSIAASLLERAGFTHVLHVTDGYDEWRSRWPVANGHTHEHPHEHR